MPTTPDAERVIKTGVAVAGFKCIVRAWWWQQHYSIVATLAEFESKRPKHSSTTDRKEKAEARVADEKENKRVKREGYVHHVG
jgi:hypothetical protein